MSRQELPISLTLLAAAMLLSPSVRAQGKEGCVAVNHVGTVSGRPFTGEIRTLESDPTVKDSMRISPFVEEVARDREGRLRSERYARSSPAKTSRSHTLTMRDGSTLTVDQEELSRVITIFDCSTGTTIQIQPGMRIARIIQGPRPTHPSDPNRQYSSPFFPSRYSKPDPRMHFEDLGFREIQGVAAHGGRFITIGTEQDGEWNGKPVSSAEHWVSDDLAATLLLIRKDLEKGTEGRVELINIKFVDPDPDLFKIPEGYVVNPTPDDMPKEFNAGSKVPAQH